MYAELTERVKIYAMRTKVVRMSANQNAVKGGGDSAFLLAVSKYV